MFLRRRLLTTLITLATTATVLPTFACPPGGHRGGYSRGYSGGHHRPVYYSQPQAVYSAPPVYHAPPVYRAPVTHAVPVAQTVPAATAAVQQAKALADQATAAARVRATAAQAKAAFLARNYGSALAFMNEVVKAAPKNNEALQFRSLIHFALGDYKPAAADAYEAIQYGPLWNKQILLGLYGDLAIYDRQFLALKTAAEDQPEALDVHFLLAYQSLLAGDLAAGEQELETVLTIKPAEPLATNLLKLVQDARQKQTTVAVELQ